MTSVCATAIVVAVSKNAYADLTSTTAFETDLVIASLAFFRFSTDGAVVVKTAEITLT